MYSQFKEGIRAGLLSSAELRGKKLLLMLSGGADSMVLLHFLVELREELGFELAAFSLDHMFRAENSLEDLNFVREEAGSRGLRLHAYRRNVAARARELGMGDELCARLTRYTLAHSLKLCYGYDYIVSAHHRSDAVESIFLHFIRGSGLKGLRGIRSREGAVLRPLLFASKIEILDIARELHIPYREDETNSENRYSRNYLRNEILPRLERLNPNLEATLMRTAALLSDEDSFIEDRAEERLKEISLNKPHGLALDLEGFRRTAPALKRRILMRILRAHLGGVDVYSSVVEELIRLSEAPCGKKLEFRGLLFEVERRELLVRIRRQAEDLETVKLKYGLNRLRALSSSNTPLSMRRMQSVSPHIAGLTPPLSLLCKEAELRSGFIYLDEGIYLPDRDSALIDYLLLPKELFDKGLVVRKRGPEDYVRPLRLKGSRRKLKKLLNDYKIPAHEREGLIYVADGFEVLWILGIDKTYVHGAILSNNEKSINIVLIRAYSL